MPRARASVQPVRVVAVSDAEAMVRELSPRSPRWRGRQGRLEAGDWCFRGHGDASWPLVPSALRPEARLPGTGAPRPSTAHRLAQIDNEAIALREFVFQADASGLPVPGATEILHTPHERRERLWDAGARAARGDEGARWPPDHLLDTFALAQQYGVPTRLLDWTEQPLVAAYFAALHACRAGRTRGKLAVWAFNRPFLLTLLESPRERGRFVLLRSPRAHNPNLHAQGGVFTIDRAPRPAGARRLGPQPLEAAVSEALRRADRPLLREIRAFLPGMVKLTVPSAQAGRLLRLLADHRVTAAAIFPGYEGVVMSLEERAFFAR